ncbi:MAG TPA: cytochrome c3 family protein [Terriglobales bacterium]|nr:cytochrome c3 family protein [Terriglobales bacterium]
MKQLGVLSLLLAIALGGAARAQTQITGDVIGAHDLSPNSTSPVNGRLSGSCLYCHAPHSGVGGITPLWNQTLSTQIYTPYSSTTYHQNGNTQPPPGGPTSLCLSCHDGTVAPGLTAAYGQLTMTGTMRPSDQLGSNLQSSHPFSLILPMKDSADLVATLVSQGKTADPTGAVQLVSGNVECTSCHNPHIQAVDRLSPDFLVRDNSSGQICLACHDPNRVTTGQTNPLAQWYASIHATASNQTASQPDVGPYGTVGRNGCGSCHQTHNAPGAARLLRGPDEQACISCHNGGSNISPTPLNVFAEFAKIGHPFPAGNNTHDGNESAVLNQNRHATCVDCHNPHASSQTTSFAAPPGVRPSQNLVVGVSATDGVTTVFPAVNQYENCLRCHGISTGKIADLKFGYLPARLVAAGDPLNLIPQFSISAISSHPVMHSRSSALPQASLRSYMMQLDGITQGRVMGTQILCTDCHNSDDNREFGGIGANGPHGSKWTHILERRYEFSQAAVPGEAISNLFPNPDLSVNGPYALCAKCHDLSIVLGATSWAGHATHTGTDGLSCSSCHTAHGMGGTSATISGQRLINFDVNVVAANGSSPISFQESPQPTCTLTCHGHAHNSSHY